jgi:hypothetical protein
VLRVMWARLWPACGIAGWVVIFTGLFIHGYPDIGASPQAVARWAASTDSTRFAVGIDVEAIGHLVFLFFFAWLCDVLRRSGGTSWLLTLALAAAVAWAAVELATNGVWTAVLDSGKRGLDAQALAGLRDVAQEMYANNVLLAPALVALGVAGLRATALPRWLTWSALVIGLAMAVPPLAQLVQLVLLVWVVVVAVLYLIRPAGVAAEPVPAAEANSPPPT